MRIEPPPSEPWASGPMPAATAAPRRRSTRPGVRVVSCGLRVMPKSRLLGRRRAPISGVLVFPISTAPARRRRATQAASVPGTLSVKAERSVGRRVGRRVGEVLGRERDAVQRAAPDVRQAVALARLGQARSPSQATTALMRGFSASSRSSASRHASSAERSPLMPLLRSPADRTLAGICRSAMTRSSIPPKSVISAEAAAVAASGAADFPAGASPWAAAGSASSAS